MTNMLVYRVFGYSLICEEMVDPRSSDCGILVIFRRLFIILCLKSSNLGTVGWNSCVLESETI